MDDESATQHLMRKDVDTNDEELSPIDHSIDDFGVNKAFFRRLKHLLAIGFEHSYTSKAARWLYMDLVCMIFSMGILAALLNPLVGSLMDAMVHPSGKEGTVASLILKATILCLIGGVLMVGGLTAGTYAAIEVRSQITLQMHKRLFRNKMLHRVVVQNNMDNVDQRLTTDVMDFVERFSLAMWGTLDGMGCLGAVIQCVMSVATVFGYGPVVYGSVIVVMIVCCVCCVYFMGPVARYTYKQDVLEGDFRNAHSRVREFSECIAFYKGDRKEWTYATDLLWSLLRNWRYLIRLEMILFIVSVWGTDLNPCNMTNLIGSALSYAVKVQGTATLNNIQDVMTLIIQIANGLGSSVTVANILANFAPICGAVHRIGAFMESIEEETQINKVAAAEAAAGIGIGTSSIINNDEEGQQQDPHCIYVRNVTLLTPSGHSILSTPLNAKISPDEHVAIVGPSGCGKSTLLRRLCGLTQRTFGTVTFPVGSKVLFLPQRPYLPKGSIRDQIQYPENPPVSNDLELQKILDRVHLSHLYQLYGLDEVQPWHDMLSGGEQQRLVMARALYHKPQFCFMDEATSALDVSLETDLLDELKAAGITLVSVAHRPSCIVAHTKALRMIEGGSWEYTDIDPSEAGRWLGEEDPLCDAQGSSTCGSKAAFATAAERVTAPHQHHEEYGFVRTMKNLAHVFRLGFTKKTSLLFQGYMFFTIVSTAIAVLVIHLTGTLYKDVLDPPSQATSLLYVGCFAAALLGTAVYLTAAWWGRLLMLEWRRTIVSRAHTAYFSRIRHLPTFYRINVFDRDSKLDNCDQRITQDIREASLLLGRYVFGDFTASGIIPNIVAVIGYLIYNCITLWQASLFAVAFGVVYGVAILANSFAIARQAYHVKQNFGTFRFHHARVIVFAESISFFNGEQWENKAADDSWNEVYKALRVLVWKKLPFSVFTIVGMLVMKLVGYGVVLLWVVVMHNPFPESTATEDANRVLGSVNNMLNGITNIILIIPALAATFGLVNRISVFFQETNDMANVEIPKEAVYIEEDSGESAGKPAVVIEDLIHPTLIRPLSLKVDTSSPEGPESGGLWIKGPSGCGKSTILRLIAGLFPYPSGIVRVPSSKHIAFIPQRPYTAVGTLVAQLCYPHTNEVYERPKMADALRTVGLFYLMDRFGWDTVAMWDNVLSLGEQQRLAIARVLLLQPSIVVMDESTSSLNVEYEKVCLEACVRHGIVLISVAHRPSVAPYHKHALIISESGNWSYR